MNFGGPPPKSDECLSKNSQLPTSKYGTSKTIAQLVNHQFPLQSDQFMGTLFQTDPYTSLKTQDTMPAGEGAEVG